MSKVYVNDIWVEDLFKWFSDHVSSSGGDGGGVICCGNPDETAKMFVEWWASERGLDEKGDWNTTVFGKPHVVHYGLDRFPHPRDEYTVNNVRFINYHDSNENYMFCDKEVDIGFSDYSFVVTGDCHWGWSNQGKVSVKKI